MNILTFTETKRLNCPSTKLKKFTCTEEGCNKSYTTKNHLDRHINSVHRENDNATIYSCPSCMKRYSNRQNLKRHIKIHHVLRSQPVCDICKLEFRKKTQLKAHMFHHTGIKSFSCELCPEEFISLYDRRRHMRFHKTYNCDICQKQFNRWSIYQKHRKKDHEVSEYLCNECGRSFKQRGHIIRHLKQHSPKPNVKYHFCPYENCTKKYTRRSNMKVHILSQHEGYSYDCTICEAKLSSKAKLVQHEQMHKRLVEKPPPKTINTGRKVRKDKGITRASTALKLAGIPKEPDDGESETTLVNSGFLQVHIQC